MSSRDMAFYRRMAASMVWSDKRVDESFSDVANRCVKDMAEHGLPNVDPRKVLAWAVEDRVVAICENELRTEANRRAQPRTRPELPPVNPERLEQVRQALLEQVGLAPRI